MNILLIATLYTPYRLGGAEVVFQHSVDELKKKHAVSLLTSAPWKGFRSLRPTRTEEDGVMVYRFYPLNLCWFVFFLKKPLVVRFIWHVLDTFNVHSYGIVRAVIAAVKPDVVITHNIKGIGYTISLAIAHSHVPHIHTVHDIQLIHPSGVLTLGMEHSLAMRMVSYAWSAMTRWLFGSPSAVVFPSRFLRDFYTRHRLFTSSQQKVLPNPHRALSGGRIRAQRENSPMTFAFIGQIEDHKGVPFLLQTWSEWKRDDVRLVVAGKGSLEPHVRGAAVGDSRITFVGFTDSVGLLLSDVAYVVVPSLCYENAPMIIFESFARGVPIIAARIGGIPEYVEEGVNGFLFTPGDRCALREALERAYCSRDRAAELSRNARECVQDATVARYCNALLAIIRHPMSSFNDKTGSYH